MREAVYLIAHSQFTCAIKPIQLYRYAVKSLVDKACDDSIEESSEELQNFCTIVEHILNYRLRPTQTWYGSIEPRSFWKYINVACRRLPNSCLHSIKNLEYPATARGKGRAWLRMALMEKRLSEYLVTAIEQKTLTRRFYLDGAIVLSESGQMLAGMFLGLHSIDFSFDVRSSNLDFSLTPVINYTPYLKFDQRSQGEGAEAVSATVARCQYLAGEDSAQQKYTVLEHKYKVACEQKGYLEELVRLREMQLEEVHVQRQKLFETVQRFEVENKKERQQLESVIIELQAQMAKMKEDNEKQVEKLRILLRQYGPPNMAPVVTMTDMTSLSPMVTRRPVSRVQSELHSSPVVSDPGRNVSLDGRSITSADSRTLIGVDTRLPSADSRSLISSDNKSLLSATSTTSLLQKEETPSMIALAGSVCSESSSRSGDIPTQTVISGGHTSQVSQKEAHVETELTADEQHEKCPAKPVSPLHVQDAGDPNNGDSLPNQNQDNIITVSLDTSQPELIHRDETHDENEQRDDQRKTKNIVTDETVATTDIDTGKGDLDVTVQDNDPRPDLLATCDQQESPGLAADSVELNHMTNS